MPDQRATPGEPHASLWWLSILVIMFACAVWCGACAGPGATSGATEVETQPTGSGPPAPAPEVVCETCQDVAPCPDPPELPPCDPSAVADFETGSYALGPGDADGLNRAAACMHAAPVRVVVEGHADPRGTTEYNLALGQRRADSVASYLAGRGVPRDLVRPVSRGELYSQGQGVDGWRMDRRAVVRPVE